MEHKRLGYLFSSKELRKLTFENPHLPIMVEAKTELCADDSYSSWIACSIHCRIGEVLDCDQTINDERIYFDRQEFIDDVVNWVENTFFADLVIGENQPEPTEEDVNNKIEQIIKEYEPYWRKVIIICAGT